MIKYIAFIPLLAIVACGPNDPATISHASVHEQEQVYSDKTAVVAILAPDAWTSSDRFNRWSDNKKTADMVHIFAHPNNKDDFAEFRASKHFATAQNLARAVANTIISANGNRVIIFIVTHGAQSGNLCYENQRSCSVTEDVLVDVLTLYRPHANHVEEVLIVPLSCYSKPIMDRFFAKTKDTSWPFALSFLAQQNDIDSGSQSPAETLLENLLIPVDEISVNEFENTLSITELDAYIQFNNSVVTALGISHVYELRHVKQPKSPLTLANFGFDIGMQHHCANRPDGDDFPEGEYANVILERECLPRHLHKYVATLLVNRSDYQTINIPLNGDATKRVFNNDLAGKRFRDLSVILHRQGR